MQQDVAFALKIIDRKIEKCVYVYVYVSSQILLLNSKIGDMILPSKRVDIIILI